VNRRRWLTLLTAGAAVLVATTGTGGFSAVEADRGLDVSVVADDRAHLGITVEETTGANGSTFTLLTLDDNFPHGTDVRVESVAAPDNAPIRVKSWSMDGPVDVTCVETTADTDVTLLIDARGDGVRVIKHKQVTVTCEEFTTNSTTETPTTTAD
jgi:hypothetical protein